MSSHVCVYGSIPIMFLPVILLHPFLPRVKSRHKAGIMLAKGVRCWPSFKFNTVDWLFAYNHVTVRDHLPRITHFKTSCLTSFSAQLWQYRDRRKFKVGIEVVSRYSDTQLQVGENHIFFFI